MSDKPRQFVFLAKSDSWNFRSWEVPSNEVSREVVAFYSLFGITAFSALVYAFVPYEELMKQRGLSKG